MNTSSGADTEARLIVKGKRQIYRKLKGVFTIGRSSRSDLVIKGNGISRNHAEVRAMDNGQYFVLDVGSRNGTFVNGTRVSGSRLLRSGDLIAIGDCELSFLNSEDLERSAVPTTVTTSETTDVRLEDRLAVTLVSDIRGYTSLSQQHGKAFQTLVAEWFRTVVALVKMNGGVVDKIHGDGILAYWWHHETARHDSVGGALETCDGLITLRDEFAEQLRQELEVDRFEIGIGVHMGMIMLGNLGSGATQAFTAVGDAVNLTFRIEELTKTLGHPVLVSGEVAQHAPEKFTLMDLGEAPIRGRAGNLRLHALQGSLERSRDSLPVLEGADDDEEEKTAPHTLKSFTGT